jgi:hypothetical protein
MVQSTVDAEGMHPPQANSFSFMGDRLSEAMIATAAGFFLSGSDVVLGGEKVQDFRQTFHNLYTEMPYMARMVVVAGLRATGFTIEDEPVMVDTPNVSPEKALSYELLSRNSYNVAVTIIDMAMQATSKDSPAFSQEITDFALHVG